MPCALKDLFKNVANYSPKFVDDIKYSSRTSTIAEAFRRHIKRRHLVYQLHY